MANGNASGLTRRSIKTVARGAKWLVPATALVAGASSMLRLSITPEGWVNETVCDAAATIDKFTPDPAPGLAVAGVALTYWCIKERDEAAAVLNALAGWLTGIPGADRVIRWGIKGLNFMFATIKRKMYEQIRAEGHVEGHAQGRVEGRAESRREADAEWQAWLQRRTATGSFVHDDNDPPPIQR